MTFSFPSEKKRLATFAHSQFHVAGCFRSSTKIPIPVFPDYFPSSSASPFIVVSIEQMGQQFPPGCPNQSRISQNLENLRRRDPQSREYLRPLFGQVAVATVRNVLINSVASLQNVDKLLASKVAELRAKREQLKTLGNECDRESGGADCALQSEEQEKADASYVIRKEELKHLKDE